MSAFQILDGADLRSKLRLVHLCETRFYVTDDPRYDLEFLGYQGYFGREVLHVEVAPEVLNQLRQPLKVINACFEKGE